ncbi:hypothetical protein EDC22_105230 [Tepidamorphus gemmatus]|uniref:Type 4b pilus protein PilO2 n=1 Tax=Tepidamorphus gemmatus TaxID=747076 RepID=A0A4R3MB39_9HYPH|nr:hypothetical protein [Tepidamorphus gemmatus]TCT10730.1 hypothetical protein EDC22_105230 [Tepidamorphus gemmatus]
MTIVVIRALQLAAGLTWQFHASRRDHRSAAAEGQVEGWVEVACDDGLLSGWYSLAPPPGQRIYAGGLVVGAVAPDALIYHEFEPGRVWVCALRDGLPLPDTDRIGAPVMAEAVMAEILAYQPDTPVFGSHASARAGLDDLLADVTPSRAFRVRRPGADWRRRAVLGGLAVAVLGLVWVAIRPEPAMRPPAPVETRSQPALTQAPAPLRPLRGPSTEAIAAAIHDATERWLQRPSFDVTADAWLATLRTLPPSRVGYRPRLLECQTDHCIAEWIWTGGMLTSAVPGDLPGALLPVAAPRDYASQVRTRMPLPPRQTQRMPVVAPAAVEDLVQSATAALTQPGIRLELQRPQTAITIAVDVAGERHEAVIGHYGLVRVSTSNLVAAEYVLRILQDFPVVAERSSFTISGGSVTFTLEARYVVLRS